MERLSVTQQDDYSAVEAAIHVGRYALALPFAAGRRVLDVACGEGYGAWLLVQAGATSVEAVDVAEDAVARARATFADPRIAFATGQGEDLAGTFEAGSFDLVVSIETIEHVADPRRFLEAIRNVVKPGAVIVLTCPNDHWYYPPHESNPYHRRKYTFAEFQDLTSSVLGGQVQWLIGSASLGFAAVPVGNTEGAAGELPRIVAVETASLQLRVQSDGAAPAPETASYFVGVWNAPGPLTGAGAFQALSMDTYAAMMSAYGKAAQVSVELPPPDRSLVAALRRENDVLMERIEHFRAEDDALRAREAVLRTTEAELNMTLAALRAAQAGLQAQLAAVTAERDDLLPSALRWRGLVRRVRRISPGAARLGALVVKWRTTR